LVENSCHIRSQVKEFQDLPVYPGLIALPKNPHAFSVLVYVKKNLVLLAAKFKPLAEL